MSAPASVRREPPVACPYCAVLLDPAPERGRLCPRCRRRIVVRRVDGRRVLLTEEAVDVFEAERGREANLHTWTTERGRWLALSGGVSAPLSKVTRLAAAAPTEAAVLASKDLYMTSAEHAVRAARRDKHWDEVARIRREQAAALHRESGSAVPPRDDVVALHHEWSAAALRSHLGFGAQVELVSSGCCAVCRRDDGKTFRIAAELRTPRLPHQGCPKGLCQCDWWPVPDRKVRPKRARRAASPQPTATPASPADTAAAVDTAAGAEPAPETEPTPEAEPEPAALVPAPEPTAGALPAVEHDPAS